MATTQELFTAQEAAKRLGVTDARVRQLCAAHESIGKKHGFAWLLTEADILRIQQLPEFRKKQTD